jgi:hypothetical protein
MRRFAAEEISEDFNASCGYVDAISQLYAGHLMCTYGVLVPSGTVGVGGCGDHSKAAEARS